MRKLSLLALVLSLGVVGCKPPAQETVPTVSNSSSSATTDAPAAAAPAAEKPATETPAAETPAPAAETPAPAADAPAADKPAPESGTSTKSGSSVRFVANKKLEVPGMSCPYGCYPAVEKALAKIPGVEGVQLAEQPKGTPEGELALKVVELKVGQGFDLAAALAALKSAEFEATEIN